MASAVPGLLDSDPAGQQACGMFDLRPVGFVVGLAIVALGAAMLLPFGMGYWSDAGGMAFLEAMLVTLLCGGVLALSCAHGRGAGIRVRQVFVLTAALWLVVPVFGALPFVLGPPHAGFTDSYFEAISGLTTTGTSVFGGAHLAAGALLWRALMSWIGGLAFLSVLLLCLPMLRFGGLRLLQIGGFDGAGKLMPNAGKAFQTMALTYAGATLACILAYRLLGMSWFAALVYGLSTLSAGGFGVDASSFGGFGPGLKAVAGFFMVLASLPMLQLVLAVSGKPVALMRDRQVRRYLQLIGLAAVVLIVYRWSNSVQPLARDLPDAVFSVISVLSGTGFTVVSIGDWGPFAVALLLVIGLAGGCQPSVAGGLGMFRVMLLWATVRAQIARLHSPHRVMQLRFAGRSVEPDLIDQVMLFAIGYLGSLAVISVAMTLAGVAPVAALLAVWAAIGNNAFTFGPNGVADFPIAAKWLLIGAMLIGRLGLLSFLVLITPRFWRG